MNMLSLSVLTVFLALFSVLLKSYRQEWATCFSLAAAIFLALHLIGQFQDVLGMLKEVIGQFNGMEDSIHLLFKALGIAYVCEFSVNLCKETGNPLMAQQINLGGKLAILILGMPIFLALFETIMEYGL